MLYILVVNEIITDFESIGECDGGTAVQSYIRNSALLDHSGDTGSLDGASVLKLEWLVHNEALQSRKCVNKALEMSKFARLGREMQGDA